MEKLIPERAIHDNFFRRVIFSCKARLRNRQIKCIWIDSLDMYDEKEVLVFCTNN
ncbi:MAG: hypothetical protein LBD19_00770 [Endomicrobium sp.]|nr:hypothetical protein [Endomicrobium sp.]